MEWDVHNRIKEITETLNAVQSFPYFAFIQEQTRNLSKILHTQIFRLKVLHRKSA